MADVNVNIRGTDSGLGNQIDSLRQKTKDFSDEVNRINNSSEFTKTEKKIAIDDLGGRTLRGRKDIVRGEFDDIRKGNAGDFGGIKDRFDKGEIDKSVFDKYKAEFDFDQSNLKDQEADELIEIEKEMADTLKSIHEELANNSRIDREKRQRDADEFGGGIAGKLISENIKLAKRRDEETDPSIIDSIQGRIDANNKRLGSRSDSGFNDYASAAASASSGNLTGFVAGSLRGAGKTTGVKGLGIAAIIAGIVKEALSFGDKLREAVAPVSAFRGVRQTGDASNDFYRNRFNQGERVSRLGFSNVEFASLLNEKAVSSSRSDEGLFDRVYDEQAFRKGFGADAGIFSEFERFTKGQEDSTTIAMDVLNVLTSIERSSLKEGDLVTLTEKLASQQTILSLQRQKRDSVDNDSALKLLSAFESIGLSKKGERGGDFLSQTIEGLGEGGSGHLMMLKIEAARKSRPDLAGDPAALRRLVRYGSDDPDYISKFFEMAGKMTEGNEMAMDDLLESFFKPESLEGLNIYKRALKGGNFQDLLKGRRLEEMKERKATLDPESRLTDATSSVGVSTEGLALFGNKLQLILNEIISVVSGGESLSVSVVEDLTKGKAGPMRSVVKNTVKTGQ